MGSVHYISTGDSFGATMAVNSAQARADDAEYAARAARRGEAASTATALMAQASNATLRARLRDAEEDAAHLRSLLRAAQADLDAALDYIAANRISARA